jgi:hypothetical protein
VLTEANEVLVFKSQSESGKTRKTKEDLSKSLFPDFNQYDVLLGINARELQKVYFDAFIDLVTIHIWINKILLVG